MLKIPFNALGHRIKIETFGQVQFFVVGSSFWLNELELTGEFPDFDPQKDKNGPQNLLATMLEKIKWAPFRNIGWPFYEEIAWYCNDQWRRIINEVRNLSNEGIRKPHIWHLEKKIHEETKTLVCLRVTPLMAFNEVDRHYICTL